MTAPLVQLTITLRGAERAGAMIDERMRRATDLTPVWPAVVNEFRAIVAEAFATEGASTSAGAWAPLSPRTQRQRQRLGYGPAHPILQRSGRLYRALAQGEGVYERLEPQRLQIQVGADAGYFVYHQSTAARTRLPRRAMVALTQEQVARLVRPIRQHILGPLGTSIGSA